MRTALVVVAILVVVFCGGCGQRPEDPPSVEVFWSSGDSSRFELYQDDERIGWLEKNIIWHQDWWVYTTRLAVGIFAEQVKVVATPQFLPKMVEIVNEVNGDKASYKAFYFDDDDRREVELEADISGQEVTDRLNLPLPPYYDNEQMSMVLRGLRLHDRFATTLSVITTRTGTERELRVEVVDRLQMEVPAGVFEVFKVEMEDLDQIAYVSVDPPYQLVRYDNEQAGTVMLLVDYKRQ